MPKDDAYLLIHACFASLVDAAALLSDEPQLISARTGLGETALHYLSVENHIEAVQWLLHHGATLNVVNDVGTTPLSDAASLGYVEMVEVLLKNGAQLNCPGETEPTLHSAVRSGNARIVSMILAAGADVNHLSEYRETALHLAAGSDGVVEVLQVLLDAGAQTEASGHFDETPVEVALRSGNAKALAILLAHGAKRSHRE